MADMEDEYADDVSILACLGVVTSALVARHVTQARRRCHTCWVRTYLKQRPQFGAYNCIMLDLYLHDGEKLKNCLGMIRIN